MPALPRQINYERRQQGKDAEPLCRLLIIFFDSKGRIRFRRESGTRDARILRLSKTYRFFRGMSEQKLEDGYCALLSFRRNCPLLQLFTALFGNDVSAP